MALKGSNRLLPKIFRTLEPYFGSKIYYSNKGELQKNEIIVKFLNDNIFLVFLIHF